jgi:hypothetical protein
LLDECGILNRSGVFCSGVRMDPRELQPCCVVVVAFPLYQGICSLKLPQSQRERVLGRLGWKIELCFVCCIRLDHPKCRAFLPIIPAFQEMIDENSPSFISSEHLSSISHPCWLCMAFPYQHSKIPSLKSPKPHITKTSKTRSTY